MKQNKIDMTEGPIVAKLVAFSFPLILSSVLQLLFNAADIVVVGRFAGDNSLAAVGSTSSLINLLVNLFLGLSIGTNVVAANYFGAKKQKDLHDTVHTAVLLSIYSGIILTVVGVIGAKRILRLMMAPEEVLVLASLYLKIYFGGITATMVYNFGSALLRAKGDTRRPLYILFIAGVINVILNLFFVIVFKMDVAGVALATVISQTFSAVMVIILLVREKDDFHLDLKKLQINRDILFRIMKIGLPAGFQGIMFSFSNVIIQSSVNSFGSIVIAGNSAAQNIEGFVYISMNGFSQGVLTFAGQNMGAGKRDRIKKIAIYSQVLIIIVGLVLGNLTFLFARPLLSIYSKNPEVIAAGTLRLKVICTLYFLCGIMDVMGNLIRGIGHSLAPMIVTIFGVCIFRLIWIFTVFQIPAFHTMECLLISYPISWFTGWAVHCVCFFVIWKKDPRTVEERCRR